MRHDENPERLDTGDETIHQEPPANDVASDDNHNAQPPGSSPCPECGGLLMPEGGCHTCLCCGYSVCW